MQPSFADPAGGTDILMIGLLLLVVVATFIIIFFFGWWMQRQKDSVSPYTGTPLRRAEGLTFYTKEQILRFLYDHHSFDNPMFKLKNAAFCRDTGRIFTNAITWYDTIYVDWDFLQKRHPGHYISWGSLTVEQQKEIIKLHGSVQGFQTTFSSSRPSPREIEPQYALEKPGPLYVDFNTKVLLGWKMVPGTEFEVLIVQKPIKLIVSDEINKST